MTTEDVKLWLKYEHNDSGKSDTRINGTENAFIKLADIEKI